MDIICAIPGLDLDSNDVLRLSINDKVMIEIEGQDHNPGKLSTNPDNITQTPWIVFNNTPSALSIYHQSHNQTLEISHKTLMSDKPACYATRLEGIPYPTIIRMPSYYISIDDGI